MKKNQIKPHYDLNILPTKLKSCFNFINDLQIGKNAEEYIRQIFTQKRIKLEIKYDSWTVKSHKIALEFFSRGKPSGIQTTKSDFYCFVIGNFFILTLPTDFLRQIFESYKDKKKYVKDVGDRDKNGKPTSKVILLPWDELLDLFKNYEPTKRN